MAGDIGPIQGSPRFGAQLRFNLSTRALTGVVRIWRATAPTRRAVGPVGMISVLYVVLLAAVATFGSLISPYSPIAQDTSRILQVPSSQHLLGTDDLGRDVLARTIYGSRVSLQVSFLAVSLSVLLGTVFGLLSGFRGGWFDNLIMRITDALLAFPTLVLAIAVSGTLGPGTINVTIAIMVVNTPAFARLVRGEVLRIREYPYVEAAHVIGCGPARILFRHILPNAVSPLAVQASVALGLATVYEAGLSFLGLGVQPPTPSWGDMINSARGYVYAAPWMVVAPGGAIFFTVLAFNFLSDGLRFALDPTYRGR